MSKKYLFSDDYSEGAHPQILEALSAANLAQEIGYGEDSFCKEAARLIKELTGNQSAEIHFASGGTQANLIVLSSMLKTFECVIAASQAHIFVHEAGAIEATGHKIIVRDTIDGKLTLDAVDQIVALHCDEHMVRPKVVFLSHATELGTIYSRKELSQISDYCRSKDLFLYVDGARLGTALTSNASDLTLPQLSDLVDVFYIGGTKNGALLGEAIVINNDLLKKDFRFHLKQKGALLAKGRVLGIQFLELFKDKLFFKLACHANQMAEKLALGIREAGFEFLSQSSTNMIFPILPNRIIDELKSTYGFYVWSRVDTERSAIRLVTSWNTPDQAVESFLSDLKRC